MRAPLGRQLVADAVAGVGGDADGSSAEIAVTVTLTDDNVFVRGAITGALKVPCVRCLRAVTLDVCAPIDLVFLPAEGEREDGEDDEPTDEVEVATHDGLKIDLSEQERDALVLAVPMNPTCRADCKGLCPVCGGDRNECECGCDTKVVDPRLAALKEIKL